MYKIQRTWQDRNVRYVTCDCDIVQYCREDMNYKKSNIDAILNAGAIMEFQAVCCDEFIAS